MKRLILLIVAACCLQLVNAKVIWNIADPIDFEVIIRDWQKKGQRVVYEPAPDGAPFVSVNWDGSSEGHFEFIVRERIYLPRFDNAVVDVDVYVPENSEVQNLSLRLRDSEGEHIQYQMPIDTKTSGWKTISFNLDSQDTSDALVWAGGKKGNGRIDFPASLIGFASDFDSGGNSGSIGFRNIGIDVVSAPPEITLETGTGSEIYVMVPGDENLAALLVSNRRSDACEVLLEYKIRDSYGRVIRESANRFSLNVGETKRIALPAPSRLGVYAIDAKLTEIDSNREDIAGKEASSYAKRLSYAYMDPAGPIAGRAKGFLFGLSVHTQRYPRVLQEREAMAAGWIGAKVYREDIFWRHVRPHEGMWTWDRYDSLMAIYDKYGMEMQGIYVYVPYWAHQSFLKDQNLDGWGEFVSEFAKRYRERIRYMEVWNEPDIQSTFRNDPEFYVDVLKRTYVEVKQAVPEMDILTGGFSGTVSTERQTEYVRHVLSQAKGFYDVIAFHGHGPINSYMPHVNALLEMRDEFGVDVPWYPNETAAPTNWVGLFGQGPTLFKKLLVSWANGAIGYSWYDLRNDGFDAKDVEHNYGLITHDFFPKPAYGVYNMLAEYFREAEFIRTLDPDPAARAFLFRSRDGGFLLPAWSNDSSDRLLNLSGITGEASMVDIFGNETRLTILDGTLVWAIGSEPTTLRITGQSTEPVVSGAFIDGDGSFNIMPGGEQLFHFDFHNPTGHELVIAIECALPKGISGKDLKHTIRLEPGKSGELLLPLQVAGNFRSLPGNPEVILMKTELRNSDGSFLWSGEIPREVRTTITIPENRFSSAPTFELRDASQVTRLVPSAHANEPYYWKGPDDLSARIWLSRDSSSLLVKVVVVDDVHVQPYRGSGVFNGDNIQMALQIPEQPGLWEIGLTLRDDGESETFAWIVPDGFDPLQVAAAIQLTASRDDSVKTTTYEASIPFSAIGLSADVGRRGFRFNLLINDNDGSVRESYICIAPGIADSKSPQHYPTISFR